MALSSGRLRLRFANIAARIKWYFLHMGCGRPARVTAVLHPRNQFRAPTSGKPCAQPRPGGDNKP